MNIYIYGNKSFKNDIQKTLKKFNVKLRISDFGSIQELTNLSDLKNSIEENPSEIYLIDDNKIIKDNTFNGKIKFLQAKDGIEKSFLIKHGIKDLEVDSFDSLGKYLVKRIEDYEEENTDSSSLVDQDSYENDSLDVIEVLTNSNKEKELDDSEDYLALDEELSSLLKHVEPRADKSEISEIKEVINLIDEDENTFDSLSDLELQETKKSDTLTQSVETLSNDDDLDDLFKELENSSEDEELDDLFDDLETSDSDRGVESFEEDFTYETNLQGDTMASDFSSLDDLNEKDILAALNGNEVEINDTEVLKSRINKDEGEVIKLDVANSNDISKLLTQLLANKTLEITVKIKD